MEVSKYFSASKPLCLSSDPRNRHNLCRRYDPPLSICFVCKGQHLEDKRYYYYCATCDLEFHRGCHYFPSQIRHPFHLLHPLSLTSSNPNLDTSRLPSAWKSSSSDSEDYDSYTYEEEESISDGNHVICNYCQRRLQNEDDRYPFYQCSICNFSLHIICSMNRPPLTIENLRSHDHTLTLFPRAVPLPCNACGFSLGATSDPVFSCMLCNYMVHRTCIYLPRVIKITRHPHRLSYTSSIVPCDDEFSCGVCRKTVDVNYGQYSCNKGCHYAVHSKCATKNEVWDGKDLEGVPEEEEEDVEPFVRIDEETIQHFSHDQHHLKIYGNDKHENKFCQACILSITVSDRFYSCIQCDFVLHQECASLPRKKNHPLHKHSLTLFHPFSSNPCELGPKYCSRGFFLCNGCGRDSCGFVYKCREKDCDFQLDARCASRPDPLSHDSHDHPLFFNWTEGRCMGCKDEYCSTKYLECIECNLFLGLKCATFPCVAHYKHDKHPLTLCYGEEETKDLNYWCEICETKLDATKWFYTCDSCRVTLHVACLLGKEIYMKPDHIIRIYFKKVYNIARNNGNTRPVCDRCRGRCIYSLVFKRRDRIFCSVSCKTIHIRHILWMSLNKQILKTHSIFLLFNFIPSLSSFYSTFINFIFKHTSTFIHSLSNFVFHETFSLQKYSLSHLFTQILLILYFNTPHYFNQKHSLSFFYSIFNNFIFKDTYKMSPMRML